MEGGGGQGVYRLKTFFSKLLRKFIVHSYLVLPEILKQKSFKCLKFRKKMSIVPPEFVSRKKHF